MSVLWYPSYVKQAPLQGVSGLWGGVSSALTAGGAGGIMEWEDGVNTPPKAGSDSNVTYTILNGATSNSILQIYYATAVGRTTSANTAPSNVDANNVHSLVSAFDFSGYGANSVTFYGVGSGGGGAVGPCSNRAGGGGGAFKIVVPANDSQLTSVTLKTGMRGRGGHQQIARGSQNPPYGVGNGAYGGGRTSVAFTGGAEIRANGGNAGTNDNCAGDQGGGGNSAGGDGDSSGSLSFATSSALYTGGASGAQTCDCGKSGGNAAFPGGYISGSAATGAGGQQGASSGSDGTYGEGGKGCTVLSNAGATGGANASGQTVAANGAIGAQIQGCKVYSGTSNGFGGGGGSIETDGGNNTYTGYGGHGAMAAIWIELS